ncbi:hypothetical protein KC799_15520 [candidate division KSB1 bacterium]|nr:hypothetical protein [candidate division KSB1 bacterium]
MSQTKVMIVVILASLFFGGISAGKNIPPFQSNPAIVNQEKEQSKNGTDAGGGNNQLLNAPPVDWVPFIHFLKKIALSFFLGWFSTRILLQYRKPIALIFLSHIFFLVLLFNFGLIKSGMDGKELSVMYDWFKELIIAIGLVESISFLIGSWMSALRFLSRQRIIVQ